MPSWERRIHLFNIHCRHRLRDQPHGLYATLSLAAPTDLDMPASHVAAGLSGFVTAFTLLCCFVASYSSIGESLCKQDFLLLLFVLPMNSKKYLINDWSSDLRYEEVVAPRGAETALSIVLV